MPTSPTSTTALRTTISLADHREWTTVNRSSPATRA
jgi:hypothetical protein